ncbi:histidine kinase [bacterium]|nr:histidine kinase [bacterium]
MNDQIGSKNSHPVQYIDKYENKESIDQFFKRLRYKLSIALLIAFTFPYGALTIFFNYQFNNVLNETGKLHLVSLSESQRNTVDLFLQERVINLFSLFHNPDFKPTLDNSEMKYLLMNLKQANNTFVDLGFLNVKGIQFGYAGPYSSLQDKDYSNESWFKALMEGKKEYHITDIYLGFRNNPHFTIAVKQVINQQPFVIRSTLDPDQFYRFLQTINRAQGVESVLINAQGIYQVVGPNIGKPFQKSMYTPDIAEPSDVKEVKNNGDSILIAHSWLEEANWVLLVRQPLGIAYAKMHTTRRIITFVLVIVLIVFAGVIFITTNRLISYAQDASEKKDEMRLQLVHATKLASIGEMSAGIAHEINNPLAIILATSGVIRDFFNPEFKLEWTADDIRAELDVLNSAVLRAKGITSKLLEFGRKNEPRLIYSDINHILNDVINGLIEREFKVVDINFVRKYDLDIPKILIDPDQISQVFLNLVNNAGDAIEGPGTITITTKFEDETVKIIITDTGKGMSIDQLKQIFNPFYTTKEVGKGTGLGLGISLNIIESMGGTIDVQSMEGEGSSFMVSLPIRIPENANRA